MHSHSIAAYIDLNVRDAIYYNTTRSPGMPNAIHT